MIYTQGDVIRLGSALLQRIKPGGEHGEATERARERERESEGKAGRGDGGRERERGREGESEREREREPGDSRG